MGILLNGVLFLHFYDYLIHFLNINTPCANAYYSNITALG